MIKHPYFTGRVSNDSKQMSLIYKRISEWDINEEFERTAFIIPSKVIPKTFQVISK